MAYSFHGGIDGYSHPPVNLHVSYKNKAETVLRAYMGIQVTIKIEGRLWRGEYTCISIYVAAS